MDLAGRVVRGIRKDNCAGYAAEIAFFFLFALFPCLLSLASLGHAFNLAWNLLRWPVIFALMMTALSALYRYAPALKLSWRETIPGAVTATGVWIVASLAFSCYANNFRSYDKTYGSIGAVIALLFWMYASAFVILLGGEINARLRETRHQM
jgi:membrane protein